MTDPLPGQQNPADPHSKVLMTSQPCQIHKRHIPEPRQNQRHHVWPLGEGGPNIEDNIVVACPTGHMNVHMLLKEFKLYNGKPPYTVMRSYSYGERKYAELGYARMTRGTM